VAWNIVAIGINAASVGTYLYFRRKEAKAFEG
jgi:hypothetical protein